MELNSIDQVTANGIELPFTKVEIKTTLRELVGEKTPGPDGFPMWFYQLGWNFHKADILRVFDDFHRNGFLDWRLNTSFISLVPKEKGEKTINDYRPIALLSSVYKIIAKVLTNRLKPLLTSLVSDFQGATVDNHQIQEISVIANELLDSHLNSKQPNLMFRLDFLNAFDRVSWQFLHRLLSSMGFGAKWQGWLQMCWRTASCSAIINGSMGKSIN